FPGREAERVRGALFEEVERPAFGELPDRARADEGAAFDRDAGPLLDVGNRLDVGDHGPRRAIGAYLQAAVADRARQALDITRHVRAGAGQADVGGVDPEPVHV